MVIQMDSRLPCAMYAGASRCEHTTTTALITPVADGAWELLPVCAAHLHETVAGDTTAPPPLTYAWERRAPLPSHPAPRQPRPERA
jgi:hypothetical protein